VREEVLDGLDVLRRQRDQVARAPLEEIGGRQRFELRIELDAHLGEQAIGHVVCEPGFDPVQDPGERRNEQQRYDEALRKASALDAGDCPGAEHADADEGRHPRHAAGRHDGELAAPWTDETGERRKGRVPAYF
jgi:hypothetical protein